MSKAAKCTVQIRAFLRLKCGEGLQDNAGKQDFATEVAALAQG